MGVANPFFALLIVLISQAGVAVVLGPVHFLLQASVRALQALAACCHSSVVKQRLPCLAWSGQAWDCMSSLQLQQPGSQVDPLCILAGENAASVVQQREQWLVYCIEIITFAYMQVQSVHIISKTLDTNKATSNFTILHEVFHMLSSQASYILRIDKQMCHWPIRSEVTVKIWKLRVKPASLGDASE